MYAIISFLRIRLAAFRVRARARVLPLSRMVNVIVRIFIRTAVIHSETFGTTIINGVGCGCKTFSIVATKLFCIWNKTVDEC
jgi:hypothetical protein